MKAQPKALLSNPQVLQENLMRVWKRRSAEEGLNQKEAADLLGWTRGAFCQYLNGHTKLNPEALIKLANFFSVDPRELDPAIDQFLPDLRSWPLLYKISNPGQKIRNTELKLPYTKKKHKLLIMEIDKPISWTYNGKKNTVSSGYLTCIEKPDPQTVKENSLWIVQLNNDPTFQILEDKVLPLKNKISKKYLFWSINPSGVWTQ